MPRARLASVLRVEPVHPLLLRPTSIAVAPTRRVRVVTPEAGPSRVVSNEVPRRSESPLSDLTSPPSSPSPTRESSLSNDAGPAGLGTPLSRACSVLEVCSRTTYKPCSSLTNPRSLQPALMMEREQRRSGSVKTFWWETSSDRPIRQPVDLSARSDLQEGDLFLHRSTGKLQIWLWIKDSSGEGMQWKRVHVGFVRDDGRRLSITERTQLPSWLESGWFTRRRKQSECELSDMSSPLVANARMADRI